MNTIPTQEGIIDCLKTVFDPEFPLVDIWTMGLIYNITVTSYQLPAISGGKIKGKIQKTEDALTDNEQQTMGNGSWDEDGFVSYGDQGQIIIDMTLTTPACPAADYLPEQAKNSVQIMYPEYEVILNLVRDPTWTVAMIKDDDLKRMFE